MASKRKSKKKSTKSNKTAGRKATLAKKYLQKKRTTTKKSAKQTAAPNKAVAKKKGLKKTSSGIARAGTERVREKTQQPGSSAFSRERSGSRSGEQSGDLQGLSDVERADSESVDELLEEGNAFEAGVVSGVEESGKREGKEIRTREVPEDDVPGEYLDEE
jgi:hypothetical protein